YGHNDSQTTESHPLPLRDALPIFQTEQRGGGRRRDAVLTGTGLGDHPGLAEALREQRLAEHVVDLVAAGVVEVLALEEDPRAARSEEHTSELQSRENLVCRLLLEK